MAYGDFSPQKLIADFNVRFRAESLFEEFLAVLAEKAAGKRKRLPSEYAGLSKFNPEEFPLADYNHDLGLLRQIVAAEDKLLANYQRQLAANPPPPGPAINPQEMLDAMMAVLQARFPEPPPKPQEPKKPNK